MNKPFIRRIQIFVLVSVFSSIVITAHPQPATYPLVETTWPILHALGINVFMKPFTSDMVFMYDNDLQKNLYKDDFNILYQTNQQLLEIEVRDLSFHRFRIPFTWLGIAARDGQNVTPYIKALCFELQRAHGPGSGFSINTHTDSNIEQKYKMNQFFECTNHEQNI